MQRNLELKKDEADRWWAFREKSIEHSKEYGISTIRSLILINGAAVIAALTFISNLGAESKVDVDFQKNKIIDSRIYRWFAIFSSFRRDGILQLSKQCVRGARSSSAS